MDQYTKEQLKEIPIIDVAQRLGLFEKLDIDDRTLLGQCVTGHPSRGGKCMGLKREENYFHCFHCDENGDNIKLVELAQGHNDFIQACEWLASTFRQDLLSDIKKNPTGPLKKEKSDAPEYYKKAELYEMIYKWGRELLFTDKGKDAKAYLNARGYTDDDLEQMEWIYYPTSREIREYLLSSIPDASDDLKKFVNYIPKGKDDDTPRLKLAGSYGDRFRLAIPYRNRRGVITGFVFRSTNPTGESGIDYNDKPFTNQRYDSLGGMDKSDLFNLHKCKDQRDLIVVEGYPDAAAFGVKGLKNVVAVGQGLLSRDHLVGLKMNKVKSVTLALDNDEARKDNPSTTGRDNTAKTVNLLLKETDIEVLVIEPRLYGDRKDPDEYVNAHGMEAFKKLVNLAASGSEWLAGYLTADKDLTTARAKSDVIREAHEAASEWPEYRERYKVDFEAVIAEATGYDPETLDIERHRIEAEKKAADLHKRAEREIADLTKKAQAHLAAGEVNQAIELMREKADALTDAQRRLTRKTSKSFIDFLDEKRAVEKSRDPKKPLGLPLTKFNHLCYQADGIQRGLYLIGARANIGKTATMTNMALDLLDTNKDAVVYFYTLDDTKAIIVNRFLGIITGLHINKIQKAGGNPDPSDITFAEDQKKVDDAYEKIKTLHRQGRLYIKDIDDIRHISDIEDDVGREKEAGRQVIVFVDALFNLQVDSDAAGIREMNIDRATQIKAIVDRHDIPLFCTVEVRKTNNENANAEKKAPTLDDIMETGKFGYNANMVWILHAEKQPEDHPFIGVKVICAKNKLNHDKSDTFLKFYTKNGRVEEEEHRGTGQPKRPVKVKAKEQKED